MRQFFLFSFLVGCHLNVPPPQDSETLMLKPQPATMAQLRRRCLMSAAQRPPACSSITTIDRALEKLGITPDMTTNQEIINEILGEMRMGSFNPTNEKMKTFLNKAKTSAQPLGPLIDGVSEGLTRHPGIMDILKVALDRDWLKVDKEVVARTLNQMYLFEALTVAISNDPIFLGEVQDQIQAARSQFGVAQASTWSTFYNVWRCSGSFFDAIKTISVDPAITGNRYLNANQGIPLTSEQIKSLAKQKKLSFAEQKALKLQTNPKLANDFSGLNLNIYEAAATEYSNKYQDNAFAGHVLVEWIKKTKPKSSAVLGKVFRQSLTPEQGQNELEGLGVNKGIYYAQSTLSQEWVDLYEAWNMSFVLSQLNDLHIVLPKLLIPSVLSAKSGDYIYIRVNALWLAIHQYTMRRMDHKAAVVGISDQRRREISTEFGKINKKLADDLVKKSKLDLNETKKSYEIFFKGPLNPMGNVMRMMLSFGSEPTGQ